jgi:hypothetical protein
VGHMDAADAGAAGVSRGRLDDDGQARIERLCDVLLANVEQLSRQVTSRIRAELPSHDVVPRAEHERNVLRNMRTVLLALRVGAPPTAEQLRLVSVGARRRAYWGVPVHDALQAFHIWSQEMWDALRAASDDPRDAETVVEVLGRLQAWIQARSMVAAHAYTEQTGARQGHVVSLRHRLLEALQGGAATAEQASDLARELGFEPDGAFQACCAPSDAWTQEQIDELQRAIGQLPGVVHAGLRGDVMIALVQNADGDEVSAGIARLAGEGAVLGVGLTRHRIGGAGMSISDAQRALWLARARGGGIVRFEDAWLATTLGMARERLEPLFAPGREVARTHPDLAATVIAYCQAGFTRTGAAERLFVHPNTVAYRLERWSELTGWDARTLSGLLLTVACLTVPEPADGTL